MEAQLPYKENSLEKDQTSVALALEQNFTVTGSA